MTVTSKTAAGPGRTAADTRGTADTRLHRLCLALALFGALLCVVGIYGNIWLRQEASFDMPIFQKSKPAVADWPRHAPRPRV